MTVLRYLFYLAFLYLVIQIFRRGYFDNIFRDLIAILKNNYKLIVAVLLIDLGLILFLDRQLSLFFKNYSLDFLDKLAAFGNSLGGFNTLFPVLILIILLARLFKLNRLRNLVLIAVSAIIYARIIVFVLKIMISRARPFYNYNPFEFFKYPQASSQLTDILRNLNFGEITESIYASMPSGHTVTAFALIVPFYLYFQNKFIRGFLILLGITTAFARVYTNVHWPSDVFTAAVIGSLVAAVIYQNNKSRI
ncbi:MAG: phosphatase PAP2 family protein [Halanaerobiaceae bacterium]